MANVVKPMPISVSLPSHIYPVSDEEQQLLHRTRKTVLKSQRRHLHHFFIASTVYYIFVIILTLCLIPVLLSVYFIEKLHDDDAPILPTEVKFRDILVFMIFFILLGAGSLIYLVRRINWLLVEKDDELRYRSIKIGEEIDVLKKQGSNVKFSPKNQKKMT